MRYRLAAFDFDGTLADSFGFLLENFNALARRHGFARLDPARIEEYRGLQPRELMRLHGVPMWKLPFIARDFLALMSQGVERIRAFDGVAESLHALADQGVVLALVTSNSRDNVSRVMGNDVMRRFRFSECGASLFGKRRRLERLVKAAGIEATSAIYVGDQGVDAEAARDAGMGFGAVHWGYASAGSLEKYAPSLSFREAADLRRIGEDRR